MISFVNIFFVYSNETVLYQTYLNLFLKRIFNCDAPWAAWCVWVCWPSGGNYCKREPTHTYISLLWPHPIGLTLLIHRSWFCGGQYVAHDWMEAMLDRRQVRPNEAVLRTIGWKRLGTLSRLQAHQGVAGTSQFHNRFPQPLLLVANRWQYCFPRK